MRVGLFLGVSPSGGGMFQYAQSLLTALQSFDANVELVVAYSASEWAPLLEGKRGHIVQVRHGNLGQKIAMALTVLRLPGALTRFLSTINPLVRELKRLECEYWIFPAQETLSYQIQEKSIAVVHDLMHRYEPGFPEVSNAGRYGIREQRFRNAVERAQGVLVDSDVGRQHVVESYGAAPDKVWALPYTPPEYVTKGAEPEDFDLRLPLPEKFLFYPAQFWAHKNHIRLLDAVASLRSDCSEIQLVCTGDYSSGQFERVRGHAEKSGLVDCVHFLGRVPDEYMSGLYRRARALVMPTFFGPTNIPPLEAFVCGCPVAVSGIYGMPEQTAGAALLFDPQSVDSIADAIRRLWQDDALCSELSRRGRNVAARWQQSDFNEQFRSIFGKIAKCAGTEE